MAKLKVNVKGLKAFEQMAKRIIELEKRVEELEKSSPVAVTTSEDLKKIKCIAIELDKNDELVIKVTDVNKAPKAVINGNEIEGIANLSYQYETSSNRSRGINKFLITYIDKDTYNVNTIGKEKF